ncbi:MAG TPA: class I SAM-dependent methyltransferase [Gemmatimonadaceae bacterium]|jgi:ubiquinone/menaquinone biosynthesis C-methylase UbiE|nr:class I SAM-dependent methyltransferase [Gemmatimonadaceae bacterium]
MGTEFTTLEKALASDIGARGTILRQPANAADQLTERSRGIWSAGSYDRIAAGFRHEAVAFVERLALTPDLRVLDAACGSGNLTIPAARTGARVTGFDLVSKLLDIAAMWSARERLIVRFDEGTVEELPYNDAEFDVVMSMFGVMFAARADRVVSELARVTRPGGRVALANWTPTGFVGQMLWKHIAYAPPPPGISSPLLWGDESVTRELFNERDWDVSTTLRNLTFRYPFPPAGTADLFRCAYGPTVRAFQTLEKSVQARFAADLVDHWASNQKPGVEKTEVDAEYLEVIAVRR